MGVTGIVPASLIGSLTIVSRDTEDIARGSISVGRNGHGRITAASGSAVERPMFGAQTCRARWRSLRAQCPCPAGVRPIEQDAPPSRICRVSRRGLHYRDQSISVGSRGGGGHSPRPGPRCPPANQTARAFRHRVLRAVSAPPPWSSWHFGYIAAAWRLSITMGTGSRSNAAAQRRQRLVSRLEGVTDRRGQNRLAVLSIFDHRVSIA